MVEMIQLGSLELISDKAYIDGVPTSNPTLIGLALLDSLEHIPKNLGLKKANKKLSDYLGSNRLRKSPERFEILNIIHQANKIFDANILHYEMRQRKYDVSKSTIYNTIKLLINCGILKRTGNLNNNNINEIAKFKLK